MTRVDHLGEYDVLVLCSEGAWNWVHGWLLPRLQAAGLKVCQVCIPYRLRRLGPASADLVYQSRRTVVVLSADWRDDGSPWSWPDVKHLRGSIGEEAWRQRTIVLRLADYGPDWGTPDLRGLDFSDPTQWEAQLTLLVLQIGRGLPRGDWPPVYVRSGGAPALRPAKGPGAGPGSLLDFLAQGLSLAVLAAVVVVRLLSGQGGGSAPGAFGPPAQVAFWAGVGMLVWVLVGARLAGLTQRALTTCHLAAQFPDPAPRRRGWVLTVDIPAASSWTEGHMPVLQVGLGPRLYSGRVTGRRRASADEQDRALRADMLPVLMTACLEAPEGALVGWGQGLLTRDGLRLSVACAAPEAEGSPFVLRLGFAGETTGQELAAVTFRPQSRVQALLGMPEGTWSVLGAVAGAVGVMLSTVLR